MIFNLILWIKIGSDKSLYNFRLLHIIIVLHKKIAPSSLRRGRVKLIQKGSQDFFMFKVYFFS